jgi:hypothetical protein
MRNLPKVFARDQLGNRNPDLSLSAPMPFPLGHELLLTIITSLHTNKDQTQSENNDRNARKAKDKDKREMLTERTAGYMPHASCQHSLALSKRWAVGFADSLWKPVGAWWDDDCGWGGDGVCGVGGRGLVVSGRGVVVEG